jgi:predicted DNA-binding protein YlxM (UPF0122 family)
VQTYNEYRFTTVRSLREALRSFADLEQMEDPISATILLDLKRALGDTGEPGAGLTKHQRHVLQLYLIEDRELTEVSRILNRHTRVIQYAVARGLKALMRYFNGHEGASGDWQDWMVDLLTDADLSIDDIAKTTGKTRRAVQCAVTRYRGRGKNIPRRPHSGRATRG